MIKSATPREHASSIDSCCENPLAIIAFCSGLNSIILRDVSKPLIPGSISISSIMRSTELLCRKSTAPSPLESVMALQPKCLSMACFLWASLDVCFLAALPKAYFFSGVSMPYRRILCCLFGESRMVIVSPSATLMTLPVSAKLWKGKNRIKTIDSN